MRFLLIILFLFSTVARAYYSVMDTGELLKSGEYSISTESQIITSPNEEAGVNLIGRFDMAFTSDSNLKALVGFGTTDFHTGAFYKWVPIPDYKNQPAIGIIAGGLYARYKGVDELSLRATPIVSKQFFTSIGDLTPYASLPMGLRLVDNHSDFPIQLAVGAKWKTKWFEKILFQSEIGIELNEAFSYISVGALIHFDDENGIEFK